MERRPSAREQETEAAARPPPRRVLPEPAGEAAAMLVRRGFRLKHALTDLAFDPQGDPAVLERLARLLDHYAFRLFLRGAIERREGFLPQEATRYLTAAQAHAHAEALAELGLAQRADGGRYRLVHGAANFGATLEWYVARELRLRLGFDTATRLPLRASGVGGDLDIVAAAEGRLHYIEVKSSPPRHIAPVEVRSFLGRVEALRPEFAFFLVDTALRLSDKVLPMFADEARARGVELQPRRVVRETWALAPRLYAVNAKPDLVGNLARAIADGLRALTPGVFGK